MREGEGRDRKGGKEWNGGKGEQEEGGEEEWAYSHTEHQNLV